MNPGCHGDSQSEKILFYTHKNWIYDNFSAFRVAWGGIDWYTVEHAYQASKFILEPKILELIKMSRSPHEAKQLAKKFKDKIRADWKKVKLKIMESIVRSKLDQHPYIQGKLLATGDAEIVEDSPKDSFWGRGPDWNGQNHMGKIWMKLREELRNSRKE
ncbi:MAG: NADAR family protein [bacterium]|nr:NADAR family protein [bacterium]